MPQSGVPDPVERRDDSLMKPDTAALRAGAHKAIDAYGKTVGESLNHAISYLRERPHRLDEYIRALRIDVPRAAVWQSIRDLSARCAKIDGLGPSVISTASARDEQDGDDASG